ncbi:unnamed protein product [Paramecium sonneborni]|uniref:Uncharacterized protein n=1 Tax=Paramecium sonneborni TaxID=65129 RepID=A0A8S1MYQ2_9CILI|nr:unnamed protein product [Paramecium sonneborni]
MIYLISQPLQYLSLLSGVPVKQNFKHLQQDGGSPDRVVRMGHRHIPSTKLTSPKHDVH